jgi:hypothetical protein
VDVAGELDKILFNRIFKSDKNIDKEYNLDVLNYSTAGKFNEVLKEIIRITEVEKRKLR